MRERRDGGDIEEKEKTRHVDRTNVKSRSEMKKKKNANVKKHLSRPTSLKSKSSNLGHLNDFSTKVSDRLSCRQTRETERERERERDRERKRAGEGEGGIELSEAWQRRSVSVTEMNEAQTEG